MRPSRRRHHISRHHKQLDQGGGGGGDYSVDQQSETSCYSSQQTQSIDDANANINDDDDDDYEEEDAGADDEDNYSYASSSSSLLPSTYVNVAPLPVFHGTPSECPVAHISRFRRVCRANNVSSPSVALRIFPVTLEGHAALWYDLTMDPTMPWPHVRSAFLSAFLGPDSADRARAQLMSLKQAEGESSGMFHLRMQWILKKWPHHGLPDSLLRGVFVDGLREDFQDWILPQRPETLEEAVRLAANWEQVRSLRESRKVKREMKCGFCEGMGHEERECEVKRKMRELWVRSKSAREETAVVVGGEAGVAESGEVKRLVGGGDGRRGQGQGISCQCFKHQCWKKYERSASVVSDKNNTNPSAAAAAAASSAGDQA